MSVYDMGFMKQLSGFSLNPKTSEPAYSQISRYFEEIIRRGELTIGQRLPTSRELARSTGADYRAVEKAMKTLKSRGIIERWPRRGTYVCPPATGGVIGLLVGPSLLVENAGAFRVLAETIREEIATQGWRVQMYDCLSLGERDLCGYNWDRLTQDLKHVWFKGLILVGVSPDQFPKNRMLMGLPSVHFNASRQTTVAVDLGQFMDEAIRFLLAQGRRNIFFMRSGHYSTDWKLDVEHFVNAMERLGIPGASERVVQLEGFSSKHPEMIERLSYNHIHKLLIQLRQTNSLPDAFLFTDDIVLRGAAQAFRDTSLRIPEELTVVGTVNEGIDYPYAVEVKKYEMPIREVGRKLVEILSKQILGVRLPALPVKVSFRTAPECATNNSVAHAGTHRVKGTSGNSP